MGSSEELSHSSTGTCSYSNTDNETCKYSSSFSSKSSGRESPTSQKHQSDCRVKLYGVIKNVTIPSEGSLELINIIDIAQCEERLALTPQSEDYFLILSQKDLRIFDQNMSVVSRIPLYKIERVVCFDDGTIGDVVLAFKVFNDKQTVDYDVFVYACETEDACQKICHKFSRVLDAVMSSVEKSSKLKDHETKTNSENSANRGYI